MLNKYRPYLNALAVRCNTMGPESAKGLSAQFGLKPDREEHDWERIRETVSTHPRGPFEVLKMLTTDMSVEKRDLSSLSS